MNRHALLLVSMWCLGSCARSHGAELPPMGLYRIDFDGTLQFADQPVQVHQHADGASGDVTATHTAGKYSATRQFKGERPLTHCINAVTGAAPLPPAALACKDQRTTRTKEGWDVSATCPGSQLRLSIRQLDKDRWEFVNQVTMLSTGAGASMAGMDMVLRHQLAHGATAAEREKARQQLAQLPAMQKEHDAKYAATIAQMQQELANSTDPQEKAALQAALARMAPGNPTMHGSTRQIWTRIGNVCK